MHRTTIMLPQDLKHRVVRESQRLGVSLGEYVRVSLESALGREDQSGSDDPLFSDDAVFSGHAPRDASATHDEYLYGERR